MTDDDDDEDRAVLVCLPVRYGNPAQFDDNVYGTCSRCAEPIQWRPHAPTAWSRICMECLHADVMRGEDIVVMYTEESRRELVAYARARAAEADARERGFGRPLPKNWKN